MQLFGWFSAIRSSVAFSDSSPSVSETSLRARCVRVRVQLFLYRISRRRRLRRAAWPAGHIGCVRLSRLVRFPHAARQLGVAPAGVHLHWRGAGALPNHRESSTGVLSFRTSLSSCVSSAPLESWSHHEHLHLAFFARQSNTKMHLQRKWWRRVAHGWSAVRWERSALWMACACLKTNLFFFFVFFFLSMKNEECKTKTKKGHSKQAFAYAAYGAVPRGFCSSEP